MKLLNKALTVITLLTTSFALYGAETGYEIELIIFEDATARYLSSEDWAYNDTLRHADDTNTKNTPTSDPEYKQIDWKSAKLAPNLEKLLNNSNYNVLLNTRWKQTGLDRNKAFEISLNSQLPPAVNSDTENQSLNPSFAPYITGTVKLIMSRYLHLNVNLQYHRPDIENTADQAFHVYPVVDERRMRSKEIHYIDHPLVGIIVLATPYKILNHESSDKPAEYKTL